MTPEADCDLRGPGGIHAGRRRFGRSAGHTAGPLGGGSSILILKGGSSAAACTLTAIGRSKHGNRLISITAGHCSTPDSASTPRPCRTAASSARSPTSTSDLDMAIIEFNSNVAPVRTVHGTTIRSVDTAR